LFVVDTNILIYAAETSFPEHTRARAQLEAWRSSAAAWYLTWPIVYEFLRVTTHAAVFRRPWTLDAAFSFVEALLAAPGLDVLGATERHPAVARECFDAGADLRGNILHDAHTAVLMREHGIRRIYSRDRDYHRFDFIEVVDPLA
jgi:toxin-antitoxin system PIN domain toxin